MENTKQDIFNQPPAYASSVHNFERGQFEVPEKDTIKLLLCMLFDDASIVNTPGYEILEKYCECKISRNNSVVLYSVNNEFMELCRETAFEYMNFGKREVIYSGEKHAILFSPDFLYEPIEVKDSALDEFKKRFL